MIELYEAFQVETEENRYSLPYIQNNYVMKKESPCIECENIVRESKLCEICNARLAYADLTEGKEYTYYTWETGPELYEKINDKPLSYTTRRHCNIKVVINKLGYDTEREFIVDLYYGRLYTYDEIISYVFKKIGEKLSTSLLMRIMRDEKLEARPTNYYRRGKGRFKK